MSKELERLKHLEEQRRAQPSAAPAHDAPVAIIDARQQQQRTPRTVIRCYNCGEEGHILRNCGTPRRRNAGAETARAEETHAPTNTNNMVRGASDAGPGRNGKETYLELLISGVYVNCLLDTGSEVTLIPINS